MSVNLAVENVQSLFVGFLLLLPLVLVDTGIGILFLLMAIRYSWPDQLVRILTFLFGAVLVTSSGAIIVWGGYMLWTQDISPLTIVSITK